MTCPCEEVLGEEELDMAEAALWFLAAVVEKDKLFLELWAGGKPFLFGAPFCVFGILRRERGGNYLNNLGKMVGDKMAI